MNQDQLIAQYSSNNEDHTFNINPSVEHTTHGETTKSTIQIPNHIDKDLPSIPNNDTYLGKLRSMVTTLQDDINIFLTKKMNNEASGPDDEDIIGVDSDDDE